MFKGFLIYNGMVENLKTMFRNKQCWWLIKIDKYRKCKKNLLLYLANGCSPSINLGRQMTSDISSSRMDEGNIFTATCNTGYAFFRSSGGSFTTSKTKVGTCTKGSSSYYWKYDGGSTCSVLVLNLKWTCSVRNFWRNFLVQRNWIF